MPEGNQRGSLWIEASIGFGVTIVIGLVLRFSGVFDSRPFYQLLIFALVLGLITGCIVSAVRLRLQKK